MQIDPLLNAPLDNYKVLTNLVVPRPIAWVSTVGETGIVNLAPFSFFNAVGSNPLYVVVSIGNREDGSPKDTARNILASGEFVVNLVTEELLEAMNISAVDFPADESELSPAQVHSAPSVRIAAPRLAEAQASLECKLHQTVTLGSNTLVIGEVVMFHVADALVGPRFHVNGFAPIGRMGSPSTYCRTTDRFELPRISYVEWTAGASDTKG
jgi:flavin reductase (DIM6/NTAB) family NADH-FMN oxidoreductase RutF